MGASSNVSELLYLPEHMYILSPPKRLLSIVIAISLLSSLSVSTPLAFAEGIPQDTLTPAQAQEITGGQTDVELAEISKTKTNELVVETKDGRKFVFRSEPPAGEIASDYALFTDLEKARFQRFRAWFFARVTPVLARNELSLGVASLVGKALRPVGRAIGGTVKGTRYVLYNLTLRKFKKLNPLTEMARESLPDNEETPKNLRERGTMALNKLLQTLDFQLWKRAYEIVNHNQFVFKASLGIVAQGGQFKYVAGGMKSYAFRFGYDIHTKRLVIDIIPETEKLEYAMMCPILVGLIPKIGFASYANKPEGRCFASNTYYAPAAPVYATRGKDFSETGFSMSLLAFPMGISEFYTFKSQFTTKTPPQKIHANAQTEIEDLSMSVEDLARQIEKRDYQDMLRERQLSGARTEGDCETLLQRTGVD
jgi:hypothetical protein